jgi:YVTN family beta-propeller protein
MYFTLALSLLAACPRLVASATNAASPPSSRFSPSALLASSDAKTLYIACASSNLILAWDVANQRLRRSYPLPASPSGLALSSNNTCLAVTCAEPASRVLLLDVASGRILKRFVAGHTATSPVFSADEHQLYVCNRFNDAVSVFDMATGSETARIPVSREPVSAALVGNGKLLLVANHFPAGRSDFPYVAANLSVIDTSNNTVSQTLSLPNGSISLRQLAVSPDQRYAAVALTVARFQLPVTQLARGWVNVSAVTLIDLAALKVINTIPVDEPLRGAANPWAVAWSPDSRKLCLSHAGTHEVSVIDFPGLLRKLAALPSQPPTNASLNPNTVSRWTGDVPNDLSFLSSLRQRIKLKGNGPRSLVCLASEIYAADFFSDTLERIAPTGDGAASVSSFLLNPGHSLSLTDLGEMYFNDATLGFAGWQSCASCHDDDGRIDGVNWDLLNDGIGNPKDTKSLVLSHKTPPVMSLGVRATAELAVRAGIQNSLGASHPEPIPTAMDVWIKSLKPAPSPFLVHGKLSESALRGEKIFKSRQTECSTCHEGELFTDLNSYNVGTTNVFDHGSQYFDTPTLHELWRTAPFLHDGSAATLRDVLTTRNPADKHGKTSHLTPAEIDDLVEYLRSL